MNDKNFKNKTETRQDLYNMSICDVYLLCIFLSYIKNV